jgi:hypothetical protein
MIKSPEMTPGLFFLNYRIGNATFSFFFNLYL